MEVLTLEPYTLELLLLALVVSSLLRVFAMAIGAICLGLAIAAVGVYSDFRDHFVGEDSPYKDRSERHIRIVCLLLMWLGSGAFQLLDHTALAFIWAILCGFALLDRPEVAPDLDKNAHYRLEE